MPTIYIEKNVKVSSFGLVNEDRLHGEVTRCEVKDNRGTNFVLWPADKNSDKASRFNLNRFNKCQFSIWKMSEEDEGIWEVSMTRTVGKETKVETAKYNMKVREVRL